MDLLLNQYLTDIKSVLVQIMVGYQLSAKPLSTQNGTL